MGSCYLGDHNAKNNIHTDMTTYYISSRDFEYGYSHSSYVFCAPEGTLEEFTLTSMQLLLGHVAAVKRPPYIIQR